MNLNEEKLKEVVSESLNRVKDNLRWQSAITKAEKQIESNPFIHFDGSRLVVLSDSGKIYEVENACQCKAFEGGQPCWHRAAWRLMQRYSQTKNH
jgi:anaerobic ribonucleoside-triphosphate reductase